MTKTIEITGIWIDPARRLCARTVEPLPHIYRAAMEVHSDASGFLYSSPPREWTYACWLQQFQRAVFAEYDRNLVLTRETEWRNVDADIQNELARSMTAERPQHNSREPTA